MKTVDFKKFEKDQIQYKQLNFLMGGHEGTDIIVPPRK
jgi:hypothetical protein